MYLKFVSVDCHVPSIEASSTFLETDSSSSSSRITLNDTVQINQDLFCNGFLRLGSLSSEGKVVINGGPQNVPNEETALKISGGNSSVKLEMDNWSGGGKKYELRSNSNGSFDIFDRSDNAIKFNLVVIIALQDRHLYLEI